MERAVAGGARPAAFDPDNFELGQNRTSWQHEVASRMDAAFRESLFSRMTDSAVAAIRSQGGRELVWLSRVAPHAVSPSWRPIFSQSLCCVGSSSSSPLPCVPADVASLSTLWATTVQRADVRGFWGSEDGLWRVLQHGSAVKEEVE